MAVRPSAAEAAALSASAASAPDPALESSAVAASAALVLVGLVAHVQKERSLDAANLSHHPWMPSTAASYSLADFSKEAVVELL